MSCLAGNFLFLFLPLQTVIVGSYLIAHGFFSVYGMCVDTLFLCFCKYFGLCGSLLKHKREGCGKWGPISLQSNTFCLPLNWVNSMDSPAPIY